MTPEFPVRVRCSVTPGTGRGLIHNVNQPGNRASSQRRFHKQLDSHLHFPSEAGALCNDLIGMNRGQNNSFVTSIQSFQWEDLRKDRGAAAGGQLGGPRRRSGRTFGKTAGLQRAGNWEDRGGVVGGPSERPRGCSGRASGRTVAVLLSGSWQHRSGRRETMEMLPDHARQRVGATAMAHRSAASSSTVKSEKKGKKQVVKKQVKMMTDPEEEEIVSQLTNLHLEEDYVVYGTALSYDDRLTEPYCLWDTQFPERPERVTAVMQKIEEYGLKERCKAIAGRLATREELLLVHSLDYIEQIKSTENMNERELKSLANTYNEVFLHKKTYSASCLAVGCVLQVVDQVMERQVRNGMAVVRPPGHNALSNAANGYSIFNNLAIAAKYAQKKHRAERVLIVDWDIHHGQGTQYIFEDDHSVLYFSIHRYEHGDFWPHLPESDCTTVGGGFGRGYNVNVPWNKTGMSGADYVAAFHNILIPIAHERGVGGGELGVSLRTGGGGGAIDYRPLESKAMISSLQEARG
ncbi:histone deacetylase 6-like [Hemitrygon akajei]|uniref:histone deacetylase 6-like n=1 Tax=Hemitrygon akajei TaxID=2704970 RepID=UPI003BF9C6E5